jgi:hypothetical protein
MFCFIFVLCFVFVEEKNINRENTYTIQLTVINVVLISINLEISCHLILIDHSVPLGVMLQY